MASHPFFNALQGKQAAIVTNIPGTTRDILSGYIEVNGVPVEIIDTAGIRESKEIIEKLGIEKNKKRTQPCKYCNVRGGQYAGFI